MIYHKKYRDPNYQGGFRDKSGRIIAEKIVFSFVKGDCGNDKKCNDGWKRISDTYEDFC